jgi:hypothetical protein
MPATGTFLQYPTLLETLPPLVRKQRRLEASIAKVSQAVKDEKAVRGEIDQLLLAAGLQKSDLVTCAGYDVQHHERAGASSLNAERVTAELVAAGVDPELVAQILLDSTETGSPALFCTVKPSKGTQVRAPQDRPASVRLLGRAVGTAADRKRA